MIPFALACVFVAIGVVGAGVLAWLVVRRYSDPHQAERLPTLVTGLVLALVFCCVALVPFDVYSVSSADWSTVSSSSSSSSLSANTTNTSSSSNSALMAALSSDEGAIIDEPETVAAVRIFSYGLLCSCCCRLLPTDEAVNKDTG